MSIWLTFVCVEGKGWGQRLNLLTEREQIHFKWMRLLRVTTITLHATFLACAAITQVSGVTIRLQRTSLACMGPIYQIVSPQSSREKTLKEKHAAATISSARISCCLNASSFQTL